MQMNQNSMNKTKQTNILLNLPYQYRVKMINDIHFGIDH